MIKTVILDWSGVVSDDWLATFETVSDVLEARGHKRIPMARFKELYELPWMNFYKKLGVKAGIEEEYALWEKLWPKHCSSIKAFPFAKGALQRLKKQERDVLVFSSHNQTSLEREIADYGLTGLVDHAYGSNADKREKIGELIRKHEIKPKNTVYVGDMVHDIETAKQEGITSIAVLSGYDAKEKLEKAKPDFVIKDLGELPALIEKLDGGNSD